MARIEKIIEPTKYQLNIVPNADDTDKPGRLLRVSNEYRRGRNQGNRSKYFLVELTEIMNHVDLGEMERGRIVFPVMEFTDKKRFSAITTLIQQQFGEKDSMGDYTSKAELVKLNNAFTTGSYYKASAPHKVPRVDKDGKPTGDFDTYQSVNFFVHKTENQSMEAIQTAVDYIIDSMKERNIEFDTPEIIVGTEVKQEPKAKEPKAKEKSDPFK